MTFNASAVFRAMVGDRLAGTAAFDLDTDTLKVVGHPSTITPDKNASAANTARAAGQWATPIDGSTGWPAATGLALSTVAIDVATAATIKLTAANTVASQAVTMADLTGLHVWDDTLTTPVADQGVCYNYLGGSNTITGGIPTIAWPSGLVFSATV